MRYVTPDRPARRASTTADVVVLALPSAAETPPLVDATFLARWPTARCSMNIARGSLVDEGALVAALDRGRPEAAMLDVMSDRAAAAEAARCGRTSRIILTPHNSAGGWNRYDRYDDLLVDNLGRYARGEPLRNEIFLT